MKIGLVTGEYPPMQGGVGDFTCELAQALAALGHAPHVITTAGGEPPASDDLPQVGQVHRRVRHWGWRSWLTIRDIARQEELDILDIQYQAAAYRMHPAIHFLPAARSWLGLPPIVATFHDLKVPYLFPKAGPLRAWVVRELARRSDGVIVTNYEDEAQLAPCLQLATWERIPIGSNIKPDLPDPYRRDEWRASWGAGPDDVLISYFGFLHPLKGAELLVRALEQLAAQGRPVKALFIGGQTGSSDADTNAAYAARVQALARELGVAGRIAYTGYVTPRQVTAAFYASDLTALPYLEGASLRHGTLMAALAHGRAIVTTRSSVRTPELRDGENVLLVPPGDYAALADGLARVMDSFALRAQLERGAAQLARHFTWGRIAADTVELFARVIREA